MLVFLRHAERGDNQFPQQFSELAYDPPITGESRSTIAKTGSQLLALFKTHRITQVRIVCSKFLRCLMTAEQLIKILSQEGVDVQHPFLINKKIGEYMREDWFSEYPLENLIFDGEFKGKYIEGKWVEEKLEKSLPFPQNYVMFHERVGQYKQELKFPVEGCAVLVVTHGFVVREMCWRMNQVPNILAEIPYCGYAAFSHNGKQDILLKAKL